MRVMGGEETTDFVEGCGILFARDRSHRLQDLQIEDENLSWVDDEYQMSMNGMK